MVRPGNADNRRPYDRLRSILTERTLDRENRLLAAIRNEMMAGPDPAPWLGDIMSLHREEALPHDERFFFLEIITDAVSTRAFDQDFLTMELARQIDRIEADHGLTKDELWRIDEGPPEWRELTSRCDSRLDELIILAFRAAGDIEAAELYERSQSEFGGAVALGQAQFQARWRRSHDPLSVFLD